MPCHLIPSSFSQKEVWNANTHTRDVRWKEEEDEGEEEWKSACKLLYVSGFNPCRLQLSANTINPQRRWREGKSRRQASWSGGGRRKDEGRWNMWGKNKRKEMKKGRRHGERSNNQGKEGEKMRMKKENKSCKGKRAKNKDTGEEEQEKDRERRRGKKGRTLGCLKSLQMEEQKNPIVVAATSADHCKPNQTSRACVPHMSLFLFAGFNGRNPLVTMSYVRATRTLSTVQLKHPGRHIKGPGWVQWVSKNKNSISMIKKKSEFRLM